MLKHGLSICKWDTFQAKIFMSVDTFTGHLWLSGREWERPCRMIWSVRARPGPDTDGPRHTLQLNRLSTVLNKTFPLIKSIYQVCQRAPRQGRRRWRKAGKTAIRDSPPAFRVPCLLSWGNYNKGRAAFSLITNLRMELFEPVHETPCPCHLGQRLHHGVQQRPDPLRHLQQLQDPGDPEEESRASVPWSVIRDFSALGSDSLWERSCNVTI